MPYTFGAASENTLCGQASFMILSDDFVFVHYPKTGGTFVSHMLQRILDRTGRSFELGKGRHAICDEIPAGYHGRTIVSCVRNPYDIKVSQYRYEHWAPHPKPDVEERIRSKLSVLRTGPPRNY